MKTRIIIIFLFFSVLWIFLLARGVYIQIIPNQKLAQLQNKQFESSVILQSRRGNIYDVNQKEIALSNQVYSLYADPKNVEFPKKVAKLLAKNLDLNYEFIYNKIKDKKKRFVWIQRFLDKKKYEFVKELDLKGFAFVEEWKRFYPNENLLSQTIGSVGQEGFGLEGVELKYEKQLKGDFTKKKFRRDARGRPLSIDGLLFSETQDGNDIQLTLDTDLQYFLQSELQLHLEKFNAESALGVVLDAKTSAIRAMVSLPTEVNQNGLAKRQRNITDSFEPGSTMKPFVVALGLEEKVIQANSKIFCENGKFKIEDRVIKEADAHHNFNFLSVSEILAYSSNIGSSKIALMLGDEKLRAGLSRFGFGRKTQVDFPGEAKGILQETPWRKHLLANISFGHGISINSLQMANAFASLVNGGILNTPYIVEATKSPEASEFIKLEHPQGVSILSKDTSNKLKLMLTSVTYDGGTGTNARVPGFQVGGKTGTAQKVNPKGKGYLPNAYVSSFIGFIPVHDPKYVIYIVVDNPKKSYYGSQVAAPVFSKVGAYLARKEGFVPSLVTEKNLISEKTLSDKSKLTSVDTRVEKIETSSQPLTLREVLKNHQGKNEIEIQGQGHLVEKVELLEDGPTTKVKIIVK
ncbi:MAG: penicillin-binding protein 2 [Bdellovibrionaceae bacterium]|nr:penicillin-binding protein 2 [Pseudobdellovibrionaceae bacterium]